MKPILAIIAEDTYVFSIPSSRSTVPIKQNEIVLVLKKYYATPGTYGIVILTSDGRYGAVKHLSMNYYSTILKEIW